MAQNMQECMDREVRAMLGDLLLQLMSTRAELAALKSSLQEMPMPASKQAVNGKDHQAGDATKKSSSEFYRTVEGPKGV